MFEALPVKDNGRRKNWTDSSAIFCKHCLGGVSANKLQPGQRPEPAFRVWCRKDKGKEPEFSITGHHICPNSENIWHIGAQGRDGRFPVYIDCSKAKADLNELQHVFIGCQPLKKFGRWMLDKKAFTPGDRKWFYDSCLPETTRRRWIQREEHTSSLNDFIDSLHGYKVVRVAACDKNKTRIFTYSHKDKEHDVVSVTWVAPWAVKAWNEADYIQLDCSFRGTKPFAYCVPQAIIGNEAIPLGFIMTPSECSETYDWWLADLQQADPNEDPKRQIILSDEGLALKHFGSHFGTKHYFCHRHIIERFGARGLIGELVRQALATQTNETYQALRPQLLATANQFLNESKITKKAHEKFVEFLSFEFPHGIWHRAEFGVARCSNHAESFHGLVNARIKGMKTIAHRLHEITEVINERKTEYDSHHRKQTHRRLNALILEGKDCPSHTCELPDCISYTKDMRRRYRLNSFPCRHCAKYWKENCESAEFAARKLPDIPSGGCIDRLVVEHHELFAIQTTSDKYAAYYRRKRAHAAPRQDVPDADEIRNRPDMAEETFRHSDIALKSIPAYHDACRVLSGVLHIANCTHRAALTHWMIEDWSRAFCEFSKRKPSKRMIVLWIACFTSYWWGWATGDRLEDPPPPFPDPQIPVSNDDELPDSADVTGDPSLPAPIEDHPPTDASATPAARSTPMPMINYVPTIPRSTGASLGSRPSRPSPTPPTPQRTPRVTNPVDPRPTVPSVPMKNVWSPLPIGNWGNTCFMGCCLQCLHHIPPFTDHFAGQDAVARVSPLAGAYQRLQKCIVECDRTRLDSCLRALAQPLFARCAGGEQHDIHEWLVALLDGLQHELGFPEDANRNIITRLFGGRFQRRLTCPRSECGKRSLMTEDFNMISCPLPPTHGDLSDCLDLLSQTEVLDDNNKWKCPHCNQLVCAQFQRYFKSLPPVLIIHLMRHVSTLAGAEKLTTKITFTEELYVRHVLENSSGFGIAKYRLRAVARHVSFGGPTGASSGHYIAYVRRREAWFTCNDQNVLFCSIKTVLEAEPYVLFYERS
jgi:hypothetical protein